MEKTKKREEEAGGYDEEPAVNVKNMLGYMEEQETAVLSEGVYKKLWDGLKHTLAKTYEKAIQQNPSPVSEPAPSEDIPPPPSPEPSVVNEPVSKGVDEDDLLA